MKKPSSADYLFGNSVSYVVLGLAVIVSFLGAFGGAISPVVPIVLLAIGYFAHSANGRITKYNAWKSEWDAMGGQTQPPPPRPSDRVVGSFKRNPALRYIVGIPCLLLLGFMAKAAGTGPLALFLLAVIALTVISIVKSRRTRAQATTSNAAAVSVCVPLPRQSTSAAQAFASLPQYCLPLFGNP